VRNLFLALLFANLLLLGWVFWVDPEPPVPVRATGANQLAVFGETTSGLAEPSTPVDVASQCLFIGPVPDRNAAQQLSVSLAKQGINVEPVPREGRVWVGHWVQIQGFADRDLAEAARQRLLQAGLPDAYVMQDGLITIISLGVFRERGRAERVIEAARLAGFQATMRERVRNATEYWVVSGQAGGQQVALGELAAGFDRILRAESGPCPPSASGSVAPE
jgi:cell division septation protein DedD